jgi:glycosyltransferase involved in cell wall biosynthesis
MLSHSSAVENLGGAERSLLEFIDEWKLARPDLEVFVLTRAPEGHLQPELERRGIRSLLVSFNSWVLPKRIVADEDLVRTTREDFAAVRMMERFISEFHPDVVMTNTIVAPWAAIAARLAGVPHAWFPREYGDDHEFQYSVDETFEDIGTLSELVVTNSEQLGAYLQRWIKPEKMTVLYPTVDPAKTIAAASHLPPGWVEPFPLAAELNVVCVGRIAESKGQTRLLHAVARARSQGADVQLALVGNDGTSAGASVRTLIRELGIEDNVVLTGETVNPFAYMARADVGAVVSDSEGFGRVTAELMALGLPVIGARVGATVELVEDGVSGILTEPGDIDSIADAIVRYARDPELRTRHASEARRFAHEVLPRRHALAELLIRIEQVASAPVAMAKLPNLMMSWMQYPTTAQRYLAADGAFIDHRRSREWNVGTAVLAAPRLGASAARRVARGIRGWRSPS